MIEEIQSISRNREICIKIVVNIAKDEPLSDLLWSDPEMNASFDLYLR